MHTIPPGQPGPTFQQEPPEGSSKAPTPFQLAQDRDGAPVVIVRWEITPAERAAIAAGEDLFMLMWVTSDTLPATKLTVRSPMECERVQPGELPSEPPLPGTVDVQGGPFDGDVMTAADTLERMGAGDLLDYVLCKVDNLDGMTSTADRPVEHFRLVHADKLKADGLIDEHDYSDDDEDDDGDTLEPWQVG
jgi:hypothetical protein